MFWTGGSKNNLQRKRKKKPDDLEASVLPSEESLAEVLLHSLCPSNMVMPCSFEALASPFSSWWPPPFHSWWLCSVPASVPTPRGETSPSFFLLSSCSTFLMDLPQFGFFGSKGLPCHLLLDIMVLFIFCLCLYTLILLLVSQNYSHRKVSILAFFTKILTCRIA